MPADGFQTSEQYFSPPRGATHFGEMPAEILSHILMTGTTTAVAKLITSSRKLHREHEIAAREMASPASSVTEGGVIGLIASGNLSPRMRLITDDDTTDARDLHRNLPPPQLEKNKSVYARSTEESNASKPGLLYDLIAQRKASTKSTPAGSLLNPMESASSAAAMSLESSSPTRRTTVTIDAKTNLVPSPPTYERLSSSFSSLNGGACSPAASPRLSETGLKMTLVKPNGPNIPLGNIDFENAAAISSPRTLRALSQRERRKSNVSFSLAPDADLAPVTESYSRLPRPGRNDDNKPGIHKRKPVLSPDWQQPQDVLKMTLDKSPDGNMLCNDSESASVSSPQTLHVAHVPQREHRKRSVSFTFEIPDADLAPAVSYSSPRAGRNVDSEPEMYNRKPGHGQEWQQPQDLLAKAKVPDLVVKLPDLDLSKKASVMGISFIDAANCAGPQRNFSLRRTGSIST